FLGLVGDDARPDQEVAVLGRIGNRIAHVRDAAFVNQVDDELYLMEALEVGHFGGVARFDEGFKTGLDERGQAATEYGLFTEEVGLGLFAEAGFNDTGAAAANGRGIGEGDVAGLAAGVLVDG